jgi:hypothetical protein
MLSFFLPVLSWLAWCLAVSSAMAGNVTAPDGGCPDAGPCLRAELVAPDVVRVGDFVEIVLKYRLPEGAVLAEPLSLRGLEGLRVTKVRKTGSRIRVSCLVDATDVWRTGKLSVTWKDSEGRAREVSAPPLSVPVRSNFRKGAPRELRDIRDILPSRPLWRRVMPWAAAVFAGLLLAGCALFLFRRIRRHHADRARIPAHELAMREIMELGADRLIEKGMYKEFYYRLSGIVRKYMEGIRGIPASEMTTDELSSALTNARDREVIPLLRGMDLVKFANVMPSENAVSKVVDDVKQYILDTSAPEQEQGPATGAGS